MNVLIKESIAELKNNKQKEQETIKKVVNYYSKKQLQELQQLFIDNIEYCKTNKHCNLKYWQNELKFINKCIKLKNGGFKNE